MQLDIIRRAERAFGDFTLLEFKSQGSALAKQLRLGVAFLLRSPLLFNNRSYHCVEAIGVIIFRLRSDSCVTEKAAIETQ
jgi:hypothetical protein